LTTAINDPFDTQVRQYRVRQMLAAVAIGPDRWGPNRLAGLTTREANFYLGILGRFARGGPPPSPAFLAALAAEEGVRYDRVQAALERRDLLRRNRVGGVCRAQPFSATSTRHRVKLVGLPAQYATCAIDALGVPYMVGQTGRVTSIDPVSGDRVEVRIHPHHRPVATPTGLVAVIARPSNFDRGACELMNLFNSMASARRFCR
jgi:hypothetical protein